MPNYDWRYDFNIHFQEVDAEGNFVDTEDHSNCFHD